MRRRRATEGTEGREKVTVRGEETKDKSQRRKLDEGKNTEGKTESWVVWRQGSGEFMEVVNAGRGGKKKTKKGRRKSYVE